MPRGYRDYEESLKEGLRDPEEAASYLNACLAEDLARSFCWRCARLQPPTHR